MSRAAAHGQLKGLQMYGSGKGLSEDWLSLIIGIVIFVLSLGLLVDRDLLGWVVTTNVWTDLGTALAPVSKAYAGLGGVGSLIATYVGLLLLMTAGAAAMGADVPALHSEIHRGVPDRLCLLDLRQLGPHGAQHA